MYNFENLVIESSGGTSSWISIWIPPIIALIGVIITLILNNRQNIKNNNFLESLKHVELEATIVRTTRLKWIDEVRDILSELMAVAYRVERNSKLKVNIKGTNIEDFNKREKIVLKIEEDFLRFNLLINKLRYYISPYSFEKNAIGKYVSKKNKVNISFHRYVDNIMKSTTALVNSKTIDEYNTKLKDHTRHKKNLSRYSSAYLKREWDRIKDFD